jgi:hypothetical protein
MSANDAPKTVPKIQMEKAQGRRDAADKLSRDVAEARQKALEIDAVKTARLRALRLAKQADNEAAAPSPPKPTRRRDGRPARGILGRP